MAETAEETQARIAGEHARRQRETMAAQNIIPLTPGKAKEILTHLHEGEPVFIFRAQDILSVMVLSHYAKLIEDYTSGGGQLTSVIDTANEFREWQRANPGKVKLPD